VLKIISECCELVKLCHINRSDPGFFETQCMTVLLREFAETGFRLNSDKRIKLQLQIQVVL